MAKKDESKEKIEKLKDEIKELKQEIKQKRKPFWERNNSEKEEIKELKESIKEKKLKIKSLKKQIKLLGAGKEQEEQERHFEEKTDDNKRNDLDENDEDTKKEQITTKGQIEKGEEKQEEEKPNSTNEFKLTLTDWQIRTGIEIVPDDYIRFRNSKFLTEQEFRDILQYENVPKIVREPGSAVKFLRTKDDWDSMRTSMDTLKQAIRRGDFPKEVDDNDYILLQYSKDEVRDETGDGRIGMEDVDVKLGNAPEVNEIKEKIPKESKLVSAKEVYDKAILEIGQNALTESIVNEDMGVGEIATQVVLAWATHDIAQGDDKEIEGGQEKDEEGEEIPIDTTPKY